MNYFELYPGDYLRDTSGLSLTEHGAYLLLLSAYYSTEKPLENDNALLYRIAGAMTAPERKAVSKIADRFFPMGEDGKRHNGRADSELLKAAGRMAGQEEKRTNEAERQRRHRDRRSQLFEQLRELGIVPEFSVSTTELQRLYDETVTRDIGVTNRNESVTVTRDITATRPQTPDPTLQADSSKQADRTLTSPTETGLACLAMRKAGCFQTNPTHPDLIAACSEGVTAEALAATVAEALNATPPIRKPFAWAIATARGRHADGAKQNPTGGNHEQSNSSGQSLADQAHERLKRIPGFAVTG